MNPKSTLGDKTYEKLKWVVTIVLPALATLYFALSGLWNLPNAEQVVGTFAAVTTFFGVLLGVSTYNYRSSDDRFVGDLVVTPEADKTVYSLELNRDPAELEGQKEATFKIKE